MSAVLAPVSYAIAALLFLILAILVATGWRKRLQSGLLLLASLISAAWALQLGVQSVTGIFTTEFLFLMEVARDASWLAFLVAVLGKASGEILSPTLRFSAYLAPLGIFVLGVIPIPGFGDPAAVFVSGSIVMCLLGLALTERIYGGSDPVNRRPINYLVVAMVGMFGYDLVMFSSAVLSGQIEGGLWIARGMANAVVVPFIAVAARRNRDWPVDMFVSRQVAYFGFTFFGAGIYLLLMAVGGYYVKEFGGDWGAALAAILVFGAFVLLVTLLLSDRLRRRAKVFFSKHFFRNRFDYREEWKRLSHTLYDPGAEGTLAERGIEALARIYESKSGLLLFQREGRNSPLDAVAAWNTELPAGISEEPDGSLYRFLEQRQWVVDTRQYTENPGFYEGLELPDWLAEAEGQQIVAPLLEDTRLTGMIVLTQDTPLELTYEDTDLLKIVGRQVAGVLAQQQASERLAEGRQFEAYSRLTAFLMHDLKNVAAQQALVVQNAEKFRDNPEFIDDAFETIDNSVKRMNRLIAQLAERNRREKRARIPIARAIGDVVERVSDRKPVPTANVDNCDATVLADPEKLSAIITHVLRNAQDATSEHGSVDVELDCSDTMVALTVKDTGVGMDESFIRKSLFRPFESTKGVDGMGIGAYQVREYVRELKGYLDIESEPGEGTTVTIRLPTENGDHEGGMDARSF